MMKLTLAIVACLLCLPAAAADPSPFDLAGPDLTVTVTRGDKLLPISQVPNLAPGDKVMVRADLPASQSAHYLLVAAFLRGSTNPPPQEWFFRCELWSRSCSNDGMTLTVPQDAQQVLVFLAPEAGGDFRTLVSTIRGRPGSFVRASQDLNQASLDRSRLDSYLAAVHQLDANDPGHLKDAAPLLARSLAIRVDDKCLEKIPELQAPCLMQGQTALILNDGHSTSIVEALTTGPASDLAMEASFTPQLQYGLYSPYIASVLDIARILDSFHTAQYQYIPALGRQRGDHLSLALNAPPSFHNPKSVIVIALPAVEQVQRPPLHAVDPKEIYCARKSSLVLPVEGAPLVFSTAYAHDMRLSVIGSDGRSIDLPAQADAEQGGFVVDTAGLGGASLGDNVHAVLHGGWGFDSYDGPGFQLVNTRSQSWEMPSKDRATLVVGREGTVHLQASAVSCIDALMVRDGAGKELKPEWKAVKPGELELKLPLQDAKPGPLTLLISQYGGGPAQPLQLHAFAEAATLESFHVNAGDTRGTLRGSRLDEVAAMSVQGVQLLPGELKTAHGEDQLQMMSQAEQPLTGLSPGVPATANVALKDGRTFDLAVIVDPPRPRVTLIGKSVQMSAAASGSNIHLGNQDVLPQDARLTFSIRAQAPATFARDEKIEIANADESISALLSPTDGGVTLQNSEIAVATLDAAKTFGPSAYGPLQFRVIDNGYASDWQPLVTLVRLPTLHDLRCPSTPELACKLSGNNLFLVDAVSSDAKFGHAVQVPDGFPGVTLPVPRPTEGQLYVKLRDDPAVINKAILVAQQLPPSPEESARAAVRHAAGVQSGTPAAMDGGDSPSAPGASPGASSSGQPDGSSAPSVPSEMPTSAPSQSPTEASPGAPNGEEE
ncbi:MAG TPA: hypothetical protein VHZ99_08835 [Steroidobacteraceae bacterium]|jgi:hypothetical protein|nr:hypothetical protein [Steroidobacteraceae bacterium]